MKPAPFAMFRPHSLDQALALLAAHADTAKILAGGQSLVPLLNLRMSTPEQLIDLTAIPELDSIEYHDGYLAIGATTPQQVVLDSDLVRLHVPLLARALEYVGHVQTRSRGTVGGSIAHADPSAEIPLVMVALDALIVVQSIRGIREIASADFFLDALTTDLQPDEIVTGVRISVAGAGARTAFREISSREGDFALIATAVHSTAMASSRRHLQVAVGGLRTTPYRCRSVVEMPAAGFGHGHLLDRIRAELSSVEPMSDIYASAEYRRELAAVCVADCVTEILQA